MTNGVVPEPDPTEDEDRASGGQSSAENERSRASGIWVIVGLLILLSVPATGLFLFAEVPDPSGLLISAIAAVIPAIFYVWLAFWIDKREKEPLVLRLGAFLWGSTVAVVFAAVLNTFFGLAALSVAGPAFASFSTTVIAAPIVEESIKGLAVLILFLTLRDEFDNVLDGILYGSLVGIGFAMTENVIYFGRSYLEGGLPLLGQLFLLRAVYGGLGHALYTGTAGAGLGYAREMAYRPSATILAVIAFGFAIFQHSAWNLFAGTVIPALMPADIDSTLYLFLLAPLISLILTGPGFVLLFAIGYAALRREVRIIQLHLRDEVASGIVAPEEYALLSSVRQRTWHRLQALFTHGFTTWRLLGQLYQAETELAIAKWHAELGDNCRSLVPHAPEEQYRRLILEIRQKVSRSTH